MRLIDGEGIDVVPIKHRQSRGCMSARIAELEAWIDRPTSRTVWTFVRVVDSNGAVGWGEATLAGADTALARAFASLQKLLRGTAADPHRDLLHEIASAQNDRATGAIVSALDQALWDIQAQRSGVPLHALLGGSTRNAVPLYANINRRTTDRSPAGFAASAQKAVADGFSTIKIAPFDDVAPGSDAGIAAGIARAAAARAAIGPARKLYVDCHWRLDLPHARIALDELARLGVAWFECPLPEIPENFAALRTLRSHANDLGVVLAGAETETGLVGFRPYLEREIYDVIMPDVKYVGGLAELRRIAEFAAARGIAVAPHNPSGPISHAVSLHASAGLPGFTILEHQYDESSNFFSIVAGDLPRPIDGASTLPTASGLGIALDSGQLQPLVAL
jgi:galactonate dehydratase